MPKTGDAQPQGQNPAAVVLQAEFNRAVALHQQGKLAEAERIYGEVLRHQPNHFGALHLLGVIALQTRRADWAVELIKEAIGLNAKVASAHSNLGIALRDLKRPADALASYDRAIALKPDFAEAYGNRGDALRDLKRPADALASCDRAIALKPDYAGAYSNRGNALLDMKRPADALASYDKAIALKPDYPEAYYNRSNALMDLKRPEDALASYDKAIALKTDYAEAHYNRGNVLNDLKRPEEALASYNKAIALKPDYAEAYNNRGVSLMDLKRPADALTSYDRAIALKPDLADAYNNRGNALLDLKRPEDALVSFEKAIALKPKFIGVEGRRLYTKMHLCDWSNFENECAHLISSIRNGNTNTTPFAFLAIPSSSNDQLKSSKLWIANKYPASDKPIWQGEQYNHNRLRVAYVSADFRQHPVSLLMAGMFEWHDKSRFEMTAISIGRDDNSEMRKRLEASFEHFIDAKTYSDNQIANLVKELEIDILVDLMGFTADSRTGIFAGRSAPIQVNYLGYPGTMGAEYIDYIIADRIVIPEDKREFYSEKVVYLPNSFQPNDRKRRVADKNFTRAEAGLPQDGFVFCCFNNNYKITPDVYDIWMRILKQVDASVLWLFTESPTSKNNLWSEATARGVNKKRVIFGRHMPLPEHQTRLCLADLFLDTLPYNAGATASDTLWAGVPVLTRFGDTFVGRMAASVLNAIDLPELITTRLEDYERLAIERNHPVWAAVVSACPC